MTVQRDVRYIKIGQFNENDVYNIRGGKFTRFRTRDLTRASHLNLIQYVISFILCT